MADDFAKVAPGERLRIPAAAWNKFLELTDQRRDIRAQTTGGNKTVAVKNNSGADRAQFEILGLGSQVIDPATAEAGFLDHPVYSGGPITTNHRHGNFCVLLEPIANGSIGEGLIAGEAITKVSVPAVSLPRAILPYASPKIGSYYLEESNWGPAKIVYGQDASATAGNKWAIVKLGQSYFPFDGGIDAVQFGDFATGQSESNDVLTAGGNGVFPTVDGVLESSITRFAFFPTTNWTSSSETGLWEIWDRGDGSRPWTARRLPFGGPGGKPLPFYCWNGTNWRHWLFIFPSYQFFQPNLNGGAIAPAGGVLDPGPYSELTIDGSTVTGVKNGLYYNNFYRRLRVWGPGIVFGRRLTASECLDLSFSGAWTPGNITTGKTWDVLTAAPLGVETLAGVQYLRFTGDSAWPVAKLYDGTTTRTGVSGTGWDGTVATGGWITNLAGSQPAVITDHETRITALETEIDGGTF